MNSLLRNIKCLKLPAAASPSKKAFSAIALENHNHHQADRAALPVLPNSNFVDPRSSSIQAELTSTFKHSDQINLAPRSSKARKNTTSFTVIASKIRRNFSQKRPARATYYRRQVDKRTEEGFRDKIHERPCIKPINDRVVKQSVSSSRRIGNILKLNESVQARIEQKKFLDAQCANKLDHFLANHECKQCVSKNRRRLASFFEKNSPKMGKFGHGNRLFSSCCNLHQKNLDDGVEDQAQSAASTTPYVTVRSNGLPCKPNECPISLFDLVKLQSSRPKFQPVHRYKFESKTHSDVYEFDKNEVPAKKKPKSTTSSPIASKARPEDVEKVKSTKSCSEVSEKAGELNAEASTVASNSKDKPTTPKTKKPNDDREVYFIHPKDSLNQKICSALNTVPKVEIGEKSKEMIARAIRQMIQPVIEKEFLKYDEVKKALDRMERNLESCLSKLSLHDAYSIQQLGNRAIRDTNRKPDIREPIRPNEYRDPSKTAPVISPHKYDPLKRNQFKVENKIGGSRIINPARHVIADINKSHDGYKKQEDLVNEFKQQELRKEPRGEQESNQLALKEAKNQCRKDSGLEFKEDNETSNLQQRAKINDDCREEMETTANPAESVVMEADDSRLFRPKPNENIAGMPNNPLHKSSKSSWQPIAIDGKKMGDSQIFDGKRKLQTDTSPSSATKEATETDKPRSFLSNCSGKVSDVCMMIIRKQKGGKKAAPIVVTLARSQPNLGSFGMTSGSGAVGSDGSGRNTGGKGGGSSMDCASFSIFGKGKGKKKNKAKNSTKNPSNTSGGSNPGRGKPNSSIRGAKTKEMKPTIPKDCVKGEQGSGSNANADSCIPCEFEDYTARCKPERRGTSSASQDPRGIPEQDADAYNCVKRKQTASGCAKSTDASAIKEPVKQKLMDNECRKPGSTDHKVDKAAKDTSSDCKQKARDASKITQHAEAAKDDLNDCKQKARDASKAAKHVEAAKDDSNDCKQKARDASKAAKRAEAAKGESNDCKQKARDASKASTSSDMAEVCGSSKNMAQNTNCDTDNISAEIASEAAKLQEFCKNLKAQKGKMEGQKPPDCQQQKQDDTKSQTLNRKDVCKQLKQDRAGTKAKSGACSDKDSKDKFEEICAKLRESRQSKTNDCTPKKKSEDVGSGKAGGEKSCSKGGPPKEGKSNDYSCVKKKETSSQEVGCKNDASIAPNACQRLKEELAKGGSKRNVCGRPVDVKSDRKSKYDKYPWNDQCKKQPKECMVTKASERTDGLGAAKSEPCVRNDKGGHTERPRPCSAGNAAGGKKCFGNSKSSVVCPSRECLVQISECRSVESAKARTLRYPWNQQPKLFVQKNTSTTTKFI
ncbi:uncharacterized protein LOC132705805 isoform X3 [Cylas formicarius]|uniref:uncharacterized protein LOC132705805 isoform X3 n=1 Tax=Cylas formicarius TaxID=197179 RepID=UPI002958A64C|nr:uncharacterized protein LOC132705805 isoform X3 [Cylas formicarius]